MTRFLLRRVLGLVLTLLLAVTAMFGLLHASSSSPVNTLPPTVAADPAARAEFQARHGLDRPIVVQWWRYVTGLARGDLGVSITNGVPVAESLATSAPVSLELGLLATALAVVPGVAVGIAAGRRHGSIVDGTARFGTLLAISIPSYWLAVLCLVLIGERYPDLLPGAGGFVTFGEDPAANLQSLLLPAVVLGLAGFAMIARALRSTLIDVYQSDQVRFARAMGMSEGPILRRIALPAAAPAAVTVLGLVVGTLITGTVLVESVFQLPGMGQLMVHAFVSYDYPLALGASIVTAILFLGTNVAVDIIVHAFGGRPTS